MHAIPFFLLAKAPRGRVGDRREGGGSQGLSERIAVRFRRLYALFFPFFVVRCYTLFFFLLLLWRYSRSHASSGPFGLAGAAGIRCRMRVLMALRWHSDGTPMNSEYRFDVFVFLHGEKSVNSVCIPSLQHLKKIKLLNKYRGW